MYEIILNLLSQETNGFIYCSQFCHNSKNFVMAAGGSDLKFFSMDDFSEVLTINFDPANTMYSCDSGYTGNKYLCGGKFGEMFYFGSNKTFE